MMYDDHNAFFIIPVPDIKNDNTVYAQSTIEKKRKLCVRFVYYCQSINREYSGQYILNTKRLSPFVLFVQWCWLYRHSSC